MKWEVGMAVPGTVPITSRKSNETRQWSYNKANNTGRPETVLQT